MYRNLIFDTLGHVYRGQRSRYSNPNNLGSSIELNCDVKSDFSYETSGKVPSIELKCDVKLGLILHGRDHRDRLGRCPGKDRGPRVLNNTRWSPQRG
jgi:hypothetical protein